MVGKGSGRNRNYRKKPSKQTFHVGTSKPIPPERPSKTSFTDLPSDVQGDIFRRVGKSPESGSHLMSGMSALGRLASTSKSFHEPIKRMLGSKTGSPRNFTLFRDAVQGRRAIKGFDNIDKGVHQDIRARNLPKDRRGSRVTFGLDARTAPIANAGEGTTLAHALDAGRKSQMANVRSASVKSTNRDTNKLMKSIGSDNRATTSLSIV